MVNVDSQVLQVANSACNAAGVLLAAVAVAAIFHGKFSKLFWTIPAVLLSAWLETKLNPAFAGSLSSDAVAYRHMAIYVFAFSAIALVFVWLRLKTSRRAGPSRQPRSLQSGSVGATNMDAIADPELRNSMGRFLASADSADTASLAEIYEPNFTCVRVADDGGFVRLSRKEMLAFLEQTVKDATARPSRGGHAAVQTRETAIHHAELIGDVELIKCSLTAGQGVIHGHSHFCFHRLTVASRRSETPLSNSFYAGVIQWVLIRKEF
jgi:hypothetical protein